MSLPYNEKYRIYNGFYFTGLDFDSPSIGDVKISYRIISANTPVSVIAMQNGNKLLPYKFKNTTIDIVSEGIKSSDEMVNDFLKDSAFKTNMLRFAGFIMILFALKLFTRPLIEIASFIPILGNIVDYITGIASFIISIGISGVVISFAWIVYRPEIAVPALILSLCLIFFLPRKKHTIIY